MPKNATLTRIVRVFNLRTDYSGATVQNSELILFSHHVPPSKNRHSYHCVTVEPMLEHNPKLIGQDKWNLLGNHLHEVSDKESSHNHGLKMK